MLMRTLVAAAVLGAALPAAAEAPEYTTYAAARVGAPNNLLESHFGDTPDSLLSVSFLNGDVFASAKSGEGYLKAFAAAKGAGADREMIGEAQFVGYFTPSHTVNATFNMWLDALTSIRGVADGGFKRTLNDTRALWRPLAASAPDNVVLDSSTQFTFRIEVREWGAQASQSAEISMGSAYALSAYADEEDVYLYEWSLTDLRETFTDLAGQTTRRTSRAAGTEAAINRNFASSFSLEGGRNYIMVLSMSCTSAHLSFAPIIGAAGFDDRQLGNQCDASRSAYWNGLTGIQDALGQPVAGFTLGMQGTSANYLYSSPLSPQPSNPGAFLPATSVPEPGAWATMIIGFALAGAAARRRPRAHA